MIIIYCKIHLLLYHNENAFCNQPLFWLYVCLSTLAVYFNLKSLRWKAEFISFFNGYILLQYCYIAFNLFVPLLQYALLYGHLVLVYPCIFPPLIIDAVMKCKSCLAVFESNQGQSKLQGVTAPGRGSGWRMPESGSVSREKNRIRREFDHKQPDPDKTGSGFVHFQ